MRALSAAIICVAVLSVSISAQAFEPAPGARAYPLSGHDMISGRLVDLDEHLGQWVLLVFWSSW